MLVNGQPSTGVRILQNKHPRVHVNTTEVMAIGLVVEDKIQQLTIFLPLSVEDTSVEDGVVDGRGGNSATARGGVTKGGDNVAAGAGTVDEGKGAAGPAEGG